MLQAIVTTWFGPTNVKGSQIKAQAAAGYIWHHYDHALSLERNHIAAAKKLADKMDWHGEWYGGGMPDSRGYCFTCTPRGADADFETVGASLDARNP